MSLPQIVGIAACPQHIDTLARWHHAEWGALYGEDWSLERAREELRDHAERRVWSNTLVAVDGDDVCGSVSIVTEDAAELAYLGSPWLASVFVRPDWRGRGLGTRLVGAAVAWAAQHGVARLLLFTAEHSEFYLRLGWRQIATAELQGRPVQILDLHPRAVAMR